VTINKGYIIRSEGDTTALLPDEIPLIKGVASTTDSYYFAYINGKMFLTSLYNGLTDQKNKWELYFNPSQEPKEESNKNTYSIFLRATKIEEGKTPSGNAIEINAYDIKSCMDVLNQREKANGKTEYSIKICYISEINEDGSFKWSATENLGVQVPSE
jgi:hypothetical protein